ncbi:MAG: type II toxin-antitoxin system HicB family antitoxin [Myxococcaceae bacterium]
MKIEGRIWKDKKSPYWIVEVPLLDVSTQGESQEDAFLMVKDAIELEVDKLGFTVDIQSSKQGEVFEVSAEDSETLVAFMLKRQRQAHGLTLRDVAQRMHAKSTNAYAQYERGARHPTVSVLFNLLCAIDAKLVPVLRV